MTEPEPLLLEVSLWQRICAALETAIEQGNHLEGIDDIRTKIAKEIFCLDDEGDVPVYVACTPDQWDRCQAAVDTVDKPGDGKTCGYWLMKARACAKRSREIKNKEKVRG